MTPSYVRRSGFAVVPNSTIHDRRLSATALGTLVYLLALPPGASTGYRDVARGLKLGHHTARKVLAELVEAGYRHMIRRQLTNGSWTTYVVNSDVPCSPDEAGSSVDNRPVTERRQPTLGVTSGNAASSQVAPSVDDRRIGWPTHIPTGFSTPTGNPTRASSAAVDKPTPAPAALGTLCEHGWSSPATGCPYCPGGRLAHLDSP